MDFVWCFWVYVVVDDEVGKGDYYFVVGFVVEGDVDCWIWIVWVVC